MLMDRQSMRDCAKRARKLLRDRLRAHGFARRPNGRWVKDLDEVIITCYLEAFYQDLPELIVILAVECPELSAQIPSDPRSSLGFISLELHMVPRFLAGLQAGQRFQRHVPERYDEPSPTRYLITGDCANSLPERIAREFDESYPQFEDSCNTKEKLIAVLRSQPHAGQVPAARTLYDLGVLDGEIDPDEVSFKEFSMKHRAASPEYREFEKRWEQFKSKMEANGARFITPPDSD